MRNGTIFGRFALPKNAPFDPHSDFPDSLWKGYSRKFACIRFSEVRPAFWGHIVCLISKMVKTAPAQMANRETKNATVESPPNLLNGASMRALSTASSATLARRGPRASVKLFLIS
jgi:hypothetical protein